MPAPRAGQASAGTRAPRGAPGLRAAARRRGALRPRAAARGRGTLRLRAAPRLLATLMLLLALAMAGAAHAARIVIDAAADPESRLEIRTVTLPNGDEVQLYVLEGDGLTVTIDDDVLEADHVEFDLTRRVVRVVGPGRFTTGGETVEGDDLVIDLRAESFAGDDVLIVTKAIDVRGDRASRVPGLIRVAMGSFSPCTRCGQDLEDYGFEAVRLELYPGDRLVAYDVTVLIRGAEVATLPIMVLPLAPPERRPRFEIVTGTATERARVTLDWPYVAGPDAYGDVGVRFYADVTPGTSAVGDALLGGGIDTAYLGATLEHRFYTDRGKGTFSVDYTPGFLEPDAAAPGGVTRTPHLFAVRFAYADEEVLGPPQVEVLVERLDERRYRLWEATLRSTAETSGIRGTFSSQTFLDLEPGDDVSTPSYAARSVPRRTMARIELEPVSLDQLSVGALRVERLLFDLGAFEDRSNALNRSAALAPIVTSGRVREGHTLRLDPVSPWSGATIQGSTAFTGHYYGTAERQVEWLTRLTAEQRFGADHSLSLTFTRDVREGETPFRFDVIPYRNRTDLRADLLLAPAPWIRFQQQGGYVFVDDRNPDELGWAPLTSTLTLLGNLDWVTLTLRNRYDLETPDPGTLDATLTLRSRGAVTAQLEVNHVEDLALLPDRVTQELVDASQTSVDASVRVRDWLELSASTAYRYAPPTPPAGEPADHYDDLEVRLTIGNLQTSGDTAGFSLTYARDLDLGRTSAFAVEAGAPVGPLRVRVAERLSLPTGRLQSSIVRLTYPGFAEARAEGLLWLPPSWLGLPTPDPYARNLSFTVEQAPEVGDAAWQVRFTTTLDPALATGTAAHGYRNSTLTGRVLLEDRTVGPARFSVDGFVEVPWKDARQPTTYLRRANLTFGVDVAERVGLQGTLGYAATYDMAAEAVRNGRLSLNEVALVVRPRDDLYLGAVVSDVWDLTGTDPTQPPFELQPTFVVVWNRCCWAVRGSWNSATGQVVVALTTPGADQGLRQVFDTGWIIPGREP